MQRCKLCLEKRFAALSTALERIIALKSEFQAFKQHHGESLARLLVSCAMHADVISEDQTEARRETNLRIYAC